MADLTTATSFYGIPPLEVDNSGNPVRGLTVSGPLVEPTGGHALLGARAPGEASGSDLSAFPRIGRENSVKLAATAAHMPVDAPGPLHIIAP